MYKILPSQANLPDHITSNVMFSPDGTEKMVEFTQIPTNANPLLSHAEALDIVSGSGWTTEAP